MALAFKQKLFRNFSRLVRSFAALRKAKANKREAKKNTPLSAILTTKTKFSAKLYKAIQIRVS